MARYTINIELKEFTREEYIRLDNLMSENNFMSTISDYDGNLLFLPTTTYVCASRLSSIEITNLVYDIASHINPNPVIFVTKSIGRSWKGLDVLSFEGRMVRRKAKTLESPKVGIKS